MIYLDSAATSLMKPPQVSRSIRYALENCASPGRGVHAPAMRAAEIVYSCREEAAGLFHMTEPEKVVFTMNATHGLNIAIRSIVRKGMRTVVSGYEHNAVVRPLNALGAMLDIAQAPLFDTEALLDSFRSKVSGAGAVVCTHVSNVFGYVLPIYDIAAICQKEHVPLIVDASQSAGTLEVDFPRLGAAFCAMPGHKGLMGPQGTGILLCAESAFPLLYGGTGGMSESPDMPDDLPDRLEAGTQNVCGIAGLREGIRYIRRTGTDNLHRWENSLLKNLTDGLRGIDELKVLVPPEGNHAGIVSAVPRNISCEELSSRLDKSGVAVRAGLHCAPQAHRTAGTISTGTVRFSLSPFNTRQEIRQALELTKKSLKYNNKM